MENPKNQTWKQKSKKKHFKQNSQKYKRDFGSLQEGHGVAFLQKNKLQRKYFIEQKKEKRILKNKTENEDTGADESIEDPYLKYQEDREVFDALPSKKPKLSKLKRAQLEYKKKISEKERLKKEREERRKEIEQKKKFSKERRFKRQINFTQKTKKGQPLMRSRMKILLEDVEKLVSKD